MKKNEDPSGQLAPVWTDANPDPWCTSPDPEPTPDIIVVQASTDEEN